MAEYLIGVDLGGTNLRCALVSDEPRLIKRYEEATNCQEGPQAVIARMAKGIRHVCAEAKVPLAKVKAVGVGAPGPLDGREGIIILAPNMPGWENIPISKWLSEQLDGTPVFLENDANAAGWGEYWAGAGRGCSSMVLMTLGTGVGGAIILDGKMLHGPDWTAAEIGHVVIQDGGRPAATGNCGALEAYASATATVARFKEALACGWPSSLSSKGEITCQDIFAEALAGDVLSKQIVCETGRYLGVMAANMANLLNPERCIFSGGMIKAGAILFDAIKQECLKRAFPVPARRMQILPAELGGDAGLIGAAGCALVALETSQS